MSTLAAEGLQGEELRRALALVQAHTGITMEASKRELLVGRLMRRLRERGIERFGEYLDLVEAPGSPELEYFINAVTTNLTSFFREPQHFQYLEQRLVPQWQRRGGRRRLRLWSAGCSIGCEPYSMAMAVARALPGAEGWDWRILATDLDSNVLDHAREGIYDASKLAQIPPQLSRRWMERGVGARDGQIRVRQALRSRVVFRQLNLMDPWPMQGPMDAIFCRNVAIYFEKPVQVTLFDRFADLLAPDGVLFIGHSESLYRVTDRFALVDKTTYRKIR